MKKRFLSVFMVLCMMLTMVPSAFAEGADGDTLQNKINQASENATITLDKAYTESTIVFLLIREAIVRPINLKSVERVVIPPASTSFKGVSL